MHPVALHFQTDLASHFMPTAEIVWLLAAEAVDACYAIRYQLERYKCCHLQSIVDGLQHIAHVLYFVNLVCPHV